MKGSPFTALCSQLAQSASPKTDLHMHTSASDGDWAPALLIQQARQRRMKRLAITDHDTTRGYELASILPTAGLDVIPGVEITCLFRDRETHLLAYFFDVANADFQAMLDRIREGRRERFAARCGLFHLAGLRIEPEGYLDDHRRSVGRRHLAKHLVQSGQAKSITEAFQKHLKTPEGTRLPVIGVPIEEALAVVRRAGGISSLAHPAADLTLDHMRELKAGGLDALECEYPWPRPKRGTMLREWCAALDLAVTGGSDFHGDESGIRSLGSRGISPEDFEALKGRLPPRSKYNSP